MPGPGEVTGVPEPQRAAPGHSTLWAFAVRNWALTLGALGLLFLGYQAALGVVNRRDERSEAELAIDARQAVLLERARAEVAAITRLIDGMSEKPVGVEDGRQYYGSWDGSTIALNTVKAPGGTILVLAAAHECVHAMFDEAQLTPTEASASHRTVEETTASVLGALLAGHVLARRGIDEQAFVAAELDKLLNHSIPHGWRPDGSHLRVYFQGAAALSPEDRFLHTVYFPPQSLVEEVVRLCRENRDPWVAIRTVARRYDLASKAGPQL